MILLNQTFHCHEGAKLRKWGKIIDIDDYKDEVIIYLSSNPIGNKIFKYKRSDVIDWINRKVIF